MGRSQLQGTPWHYECGNEHKNKQNCFFNRQGNCSCKISPQFNRECVGSESCDEYERAVRKQKPSKQISKPEPAPPPQNIPVVGIGSRIIVKSNLTKEKIKITVSDRKNPFYGKKFKEGTLVKGCMYRIINIDNSAVKNCSPSHYKSGNKK